MINEAGVDFAAENYYSDLARRVYLHAQIEGWNSQKTMEMLKDSQKFEKYYLSVSLEIYQLGSMFSCLVSNLIVVQEAQWD